jgi:hypothetical protein
LKNSLRAVQGRAALLRTGKPWMACPGLASDAGCESAASTAIFQARFMCLKNEAKQKPRFLLCAGQDAPMPRAHGCARVAVLKKAKNGLFQHAAGDDGLPARAK